jgi:hypothetical protein
VALRRWIVLAVGGLLLSVPACSGPLGSAAPPVLTVQGAGTAIDLRPWSYCWGNSCADGMPPQVPPSVGAGDRVRVSGSDSNLRLTGQFTAADQECPRTQYVQLGTMARQLPLWPAGPAGTYDVTLQVEGSQGHSASYSFRWTTTRDGAWPEPAASAAVLADNDGTTTSFGVEVSVENLARTPRRASASVEVTSAEGVKTRIEPKRVEPTEGCDAAGSVRFAAPEGEAQMAVGSGSAPFRYAVLLVLDGRSYRGTATWPDDQLPDYGPATRLRFTPDLPALPRR